MPLAIRPVQALRLWQAVAVCGVRDELFEMTQRQIAVHYQGFWRDLSVTSPIDREWPPREATPLPIHHEDAVALVGHARGKRYETTAEQMADEFEREAGDEPLSDEWPLYRGWVGFLNSIARHEGLSTRFVLSQSMEDGSLHLTGLRAGDVCRQVAIE